jgi:WD40 repeat protein
MARKTPAKRKAPAKSKAPTPSPLRLGLATGVPTQPTPIRALAVSADGRWAVTGDKAGAVRLCDLSTGEWVGQRKRPPAIPARKAILGVQELALARDGSALAVRYSEHLWLIDRETFVDTVGSGAVFIDYGHQDPVFAPDGRTLLARHVHGLSRWDLDGKPVATPEVEGYPFQCSAASPDGRTLVLASCLDSKARDRSALVVVDATTGQELERVAVGAILYLSQVGVRADGEVVVLAGHPERVVLRWRPGTREVHETPVRFPAGAEQDDRRTARLACGPAGLIEVRTPRGQALIDAGTFEVKAELPGSWHPVAASADGARVVIADGVALDVRGTGLARVGASGLTTPVDAVAFEPDGAAVWTGDETSLRRFALPGGEQTAVLDAGGRVQRLTPDARLALVRRPEEAALLDLPGGAPCARGSKGACRGLSADGALALGLGEGGADLWSTTGGGSRGLPGSEKHHHGAALSPSGRLFAGARWEQDLAVWDTASGAEVARFRLPGRTPVKIAFSPDERWLALGGDERSVRLVALPSGRPGAVLDGHTKRPVRAVAFSPDGTLLATSDGKDTRLWRLPSGEPTGVWKVAGQALAWSADGSRLAVGGPGAAWVIDVGAH